MSVLENIGAFAATATIQGQGALAQEIQRRHFVDALFASVVGSATEEAHALMPVLADRPAGLRAAIARLTEIDDIHCASCVTPSAALVPPALTMIARMPQADATELADALWVGTELMVRLGRAIDGPRILYRGLWPTYFCAPFGVAAMAGRLFGLDAGQMTGALAMGLNLAAGAVGRLDNARPPRWLLFATAVEAGLLAAEAAKSGFGGDATLLDGPEWLQQTHGLAANTRGMLNELGARCAYQEMSLKPFCSAKQAIAATDAVRVLLAEGLDPTSIQAITVRVPRPYAGMISKPALAGNRSSTMVSVSYQIALAALRPEALYVIDRTRVPFDDAVTCFASKVTVEAVDEGPICDGFPERFPAEVRVAAADQEYWRQVIEATGDPGCRLDWAALEEKQRQVLDIAGGEFVAMSDAAALSDAVVARELADRFDEIYTYFGIRT